MKNSLVYKYISLLLALILVMSFALPIAYAEDLEPEIDEPSVEDPSSGNVLQDVSHKYLEIGLNYRDNALELVQLYSPNGFIVADISRDGWGVKQEITDYTELYVINYNDVVVLMSEDASLMLGLWNGDGVMAAAHSTDDMIISVNGREYRDGVCFGIDEKGLITVNNYVSVEHYVWGVLANELSPSSPLEALKAQAVSARSYAYANFGKHAKDGFDLCTSSDCQVYKGITSEAWYCVQACQETEGLVMKYNGELATGYYYANSGGYSMNSEDVWVQAIPYLRSVRDEYSPESNWTVSYSFADIKDRLEKAGYSIGNINNVKVTKRADNGRSVTELTVVGSSSSAVISKSKIKSVLGLKTQNFDLSTSIASIENGSAPAQFIYVVGEDGEPVKISVKDTFITNGEDIVSGNDLNWNELALDGAVGSPTDTVTFKGSGSGHCVGLSQEGAQAMANAGKSFDEILNYYYTGISIEAYKE